MFLQCFLVMSIVLVCLLAVAYTKHSILLLPVHRSLTIFVCLISLFESGFCVFEFWMSIDFCSCFQGVFLCGECCRCLLPTKPPIENVGSPPKETQNMT